MKEVIHLLKISGLGGVQNQVAAYLRHSSSSSELSHKLRPVSGLEDHQKDLGDLIISWPEVFLKGFRKNTIIHSYNNLTSQRYLKLWKYWNPKNLILHERGNAWNLKNKDPVVLNSSRFAKVVLANSIASSQILQQKFGIEANKIQVIYNGVFNEPPIYTPSVKSDEKITIGYVGRLEYFKGVHTLIEAFKRLNETIKKRCKLVIIGDGPQMSYLKTLAASENIEFLGRRSDVLLLLPEIDFLVTPSIREPLGNVIIEAGLFKKPVIASNVDGIPEIITSNKEGILITPSRKLQKNESILLPDLIYDPSSGTLKEPQELDPDELAAQISKLILNPQLRMELGNNLFEAVTQKFSLKSYSAEVSKIYQGLLT